MTCPAILTGDHFLERTLAHIDCQAQMLGSYGYQSLGQPGSLASTVVAALLTIFVALFGLRLLLGPSPQGRDLVHDVLKIGIVLTLAFSWPAFRTVIHDVVLKGPAEITAAISAQDLPSSGQGFAARLQAADQALVRMTELGTGRQVGQLLDSDAPGGDFAGTALTDESALGWARLFYLSGVIGSLALLRLIAGLLLALAPLAAGLLLFDATRGLFSSWLRGLVLAMIGTLGVSVVLGLELALLEPLLADALRLRSLGYATPSAPTEVFALTFAFAGVLAGMIALLARVSFGGLWPGMLARMPVVVQSDTGLGRPVYSTSTGDYGASRAQRTADLIERQMRQEEGFAGDRLHYRQLGRSGEGEPVSSPSGFRSAPAEPLGSTYRRTSTRHSPAAGRRDRL